MTISAFVQAGIAWIAAHQRNGVTIVAGASFASLSFNETIICASHASSMGTPFRL